MSRTKETTYLVPEINITITSAWVNLITYCQANLPYGNLFIEINNGEPRRKVKEVPSIRFDKNDVPRDKDEKIYVIQSLDIRIPESWINMINWVQSYFVSGRLGFKLIAARPTELIEAVQKANFSKPETIPNGVPLNFDRN